MNTHDENRSERRTLDTMADRLKSGIADTSAVLGGEARKVADGVADEANVVKDNVVKATGSAVAAAKAGAKELQVETDKGSWLGRRVANHPMRSIVIAAAVGYLAAIVASPPKR